MKCCLAVQLCFDVLVVRVVMYWSRSIYLGVLRLRMMDLKCCHLAVLYYNTFSARAAIK